MFNLTSRIEFFKSKLQVFSLYSLYFMKDQFEKKKQGMFKQSARKYVPNFIKIVYPETEIKIIL